MLDVFTYMLCNKIIVVLLYLIGVSCILTGIWGGVNFIKIHCITNGR